MRNFIEKVSSNRLVSFWKNKEELHSKSIISLAKSFSSNPATGWVRADTIASKEILMQLNASRQRTEELVAENEALKNQMKPQVPNLASVESDFSIKFEKKNGSGYDAIYSDEVLKTKWTEIFKFIGFELFSPSGNYAIVSGITKLISYEKNLDEDIITPSNHDVNVIKLQIIAHGLIKSYKLAGVNGMFSEFLELTPVGKQVLLSITTIKSDD